MTKSTQDESSKARDFIRSTIDHDLETGKYGGRVHTRFPPEPNGYLHIGHAKAICLSFGIAEEYAGGKCNLRFDDTNPAKEEDEYVKSIIKDVSWLGFDWEERLFYASDYFDQMLAYAFQLTKKGKAYVCDLSAAEMVEYRGTLTEAGKESPYRNRSIEENLDLFQRMCDGEFSDGSRTLRAKIDMAHPNLNMRDPVMYRILNAHHHRAANKWRVYPMYDWAHGLEDSIERITHSLCTLEFEGHRPLYDWFLIELDVYRPQQIEFARLNLSYTIMSKRKLLQLVEEKLVDGWDDPRMPTISGLRRRGYTPESIRDFCDRIGIAKRESTVDVALLEHCLREDLNKRANRVMAVLDPIKVVITDFPENKIEMLEGENNPEDPDAGTRKIPFTREIYIEQADFREDAPKKYFRMTPGKEVRLKHAYYITCNKVIRDDSGNIVEIHCTHDPASRGGWTDDGRKVRGTLHWVSASEGIRAEVRLFDKLFLNENPENVSEEGTFLSNLNPDSLTILTDCIVEPSLADARSGVSYQFLRTGYFCLDEKLSKPGKPVFNRSVSLRDSWAKLEKKLSGS